MRRLILSSFCLFLVMLFTFGIANAQPNVSLPLSTVSVGNSVNVGALLSNNGNATTFAANITFTNSLVSVNLAQVMPGSALNGTNFQAVVTQPGGAGMPLLLNVF